MRICVTWAKGMKSLEEEAKALETRIMAAGQKMLEEARTALESGDEKKAEVDLNKLAEYGTKTQPATVTDGVLLADAVANFECTLESELETGDHVILVGRVVASHIHETGETRRLYTLGEDYQLGGISHGSVR